MPFPLVEFKGDESAPVTEVVQSTFDTEDNIFVPDTVTVSSIQKRLRELETYSGPVSGFVGSRTWAAIKETVGLSDSERPTDNESWTALLETLSSETD